jgi:hypothetical protein
MADRDGMRVGKVTARAGVGFDVAALEKPSTVALGVVMGFDPETRPMVVVGEKVSDHVQWSICSVKRPWRSR